MLEIFAAHIAGKVTRAALHDLDGSKAALALVTADGCCEGVKDVVARYGEVSVMFSTLDEDALERHVREAAEQSTVSEPNE